MFPNSPFDKCSVAVMHNGSSEQIICLVNYYLNLGVDHVFLYAESNYEFDHVKLTIVRCDADYWNSRFGVGSNVEARQVDCYLDAAKRAEEVGSRWLLCHDGDELVQVTQSVGALFEAAGSSTQAITFRTKEMRFSPQDDIHHPFGATLSLAKISPVDFSLYEFFGAYACLLRNGFWGHTKGKTVYRLPLSSFNISVHGPLDGHSAKTASYAEGCLLHFDSSSFGLWKKKWFDRINGTVVAAGMSPVRKEQALLIKSQAQRGENALEKLYRDFFVLPSDQAARLRSENLLAEVNIGALISSPIKNKPCPDVVELSLDPVAKYTGPEINIAYVTDRDALTSTFASMLSVVGGVSENTSIRFFVLADQIHDEQLSCLRQIKNLDAVEEIEIFDISGDLDRIIGKNSANRSEIGLTLINRYVDVERLLFLSPDVFVKSDLGSLFRLRMNDCLIAGISDEHASGVAPDAADPQHGAGNSKGTSENASIGTELLLFNFSHSDFLRAFYDMKSRAMDKGLSEFNGCKAALNSAFRDRRLLLDHEKSDLIDKLDVHSAAQSERGETGNDAFALRLISDFEKRFGISFELEALANRTRQHAGRRVDLRGWLVNKVYVRIRRLLKSITSILA
ncbi:hypothetical protein [Aliiroseovarius marinus]|uniref:hypothetical protein n=1 Tax=Aliiroseovarius marinus TaxID=2500159 RepID=UPI00105BB6BF|nr:hypothetical protein [Aliiroseovarius marinus]